MKTLTHKFVEFIPEKLEDGILYVSMQYATAIHLCASGCGEKVVTPFSPDDWQLKFDGKTISLHPSIGNWSFPCRSHYWIKNSQTVRASDYRKEDTLKPSQQPKGLVAHIRAFFRQLQ